MRATDKAFTGSIPVIYDRYLGPILFEPYAIDIARAPFEADRRLPIRNSGGHGHRHTRARLRRSLMKLK
jgi:hypothetical protein